jgi:hypothetical protein
MEKGQEMRVFVKQLSQDRFRNAEECISLLFAIFTIEECDRGTWDSLYFIDDY